MTRLGEVAFPENPGTVADELQQLRERVSDLEALREQKFSTAMFEMARRAAVSSRSQALVVAEQRVMSAIRQVARLQSFGQYLSNDGRTRVTVIPSEKKKMIADFTAEAILAACDLLAEESVNAAALAFK